MAENITVSSESDDDTRTDENIKIKEQRNLVLSSVVSMAEDSLARRLTDVRNEVEKSQSMLDKSAKLVEEMMRELDRLQQAVTIHDDQPSDDLDSEAEESVQQISSSSDQEQPVPPPSTNGPYQQLSSPAVGNNGLMKSSYEEQLPAVPNSNHEEEQLLPAAPDLPQPALHSSDQKLSPVSNSQFEWPCSKIPNHQKLQVGEAVHATTSPTLPSPWQPATLVSVYPVKCEVLFSSLPQPVFLPLSQIACSFPPGTVLSVGSRCLAFYKGGDEEGFYPGVVGEMPNKENGGRYLVFYDDGYASFHQPEDLRQVCKSTGEFMQELEPAQKQFIERYLTEYPWRKMVKLALGDKITTELHGIWILGEVSEVDTSLVEITFKDQGASEWIYRGSVRLQPLFTLLQMKTVFKSPTEGHLVQKTLPVADYLPYQVHDCSPSCVSQFPYMPNLHKTSSPLTIPLHLGWRREVATHKDSEVVGNWTVFYITPCGRRLRNMTEVHTMLTTYNSNLTVDLFVFDCWVNVLNEFKATQDLLEMADISHGAERMAIPACNQYSSSPPPFMEYSTAPHPQPGVQTISDTDTGFLVGCDCMDDCQDKNKCSCRQLTIQATSCDWEGRVNTHAGYSYRRLPDVVLTGIYECNQTCACSTTCLNRVVQLSIRARLQVFKTEAKGWGIRTLVDLPQGAFVCTYVGRVFASEQEAGFEDAYFADMDMIEVVERRKEGYESDISDEEEDEFFMEGESITDFAAATTTTTTTNNNNGEEVREKFQGTRQLFGPGQEIFIMDAMTKGNIGRYFNHSCSPNTFVQNVFVSRHDLRFPTMAFFTMKFVPAGTELSWDYSYKVGALPGKQIDCHCGEDNCRKRLL